MILPLGGEVMRFRRFCDERVSIRLRNGSTIHDLFYHFVSDFFSYFLGYSLRNASRKKIDRLAKVPL